MVEGAVWQHARALLKLVCFGRLFFPNFKMFYYIRIQWRSQPENSPRADSYSKIFATNDSLHVLSKNGRTTNKNQDVTF